MCTYTARSTSQFRQARSADVRHLKRHLNTGYVGSEPVDQAMGDTDAPTRATRKSVLYLVLFFPIAVATLLVMIPTALILGAQRLWDAR